MRLVRGIAMNTDHGFYGEPVQVTRVDAYVSRDVDTPEVVELLKREQVRLLHSRAMAMPHLYWQSPEDRPYGDSER